MEMKQSFCSWGEWYRIPA